MQQVFADFLKALRKAGVGVSAVEAIEAYRALALIGYADRQLLNDALAAVCAKTLGEKALFEQCFANFFNRPLLASDLVAKQPVAPTQKEEASLSAMIANEDVIGINDALVRAAQAVGVSDMQFAMQRGLYARRILDRMGLRALEQEIATLQQRPSDAAQARAAGLEAGRQSLLDAAQRFVARQQALFTSRAGARLREAFLLETNFNAVDARDRAKMHRLIKRMAKRLASRHGRARKQAQIGKLNMRKVLAANIGHDNVPVDLFWKSRRIRKPKLLVICDVSRSVAASVGFLLAFLYALQSLISDIRTFAFSSDLVDVSQILQKHPIEPASARIIADVGFRPTDYGQMLRRLTADHLSLIDRRTTLIILGDARSNHADPEIDLFRQISNRAKQVIWLNPEARNLWGYGDSEMLRYRPYCRMARQCHQLRHLERIVDAMLKAYRI